MNRSNRSSDQPSSDAIIAFVAWRRCVAGIAPLSSRFAMVISKFPPCAFMKRAAGSAADEFRRPLGVEGLDALLEVLGLAQPAVTVTLELDGDGEGRVFGVVEKLLRRALCERRKG